MSITGRQVKEMRLALDRAVRARLHSENTIQLLQEKIEEVINIKGFVDFTGDGFGFTPETNDLNHVPIPLLIEMADSGEEITEEVLLDNLSE